jgi:uncharacterized protein YjbI with pentapeptide repeats
MACSSGYNWCKDYPIVYRDKEKEYCVFHAPKGCKGVSLGEFNELVFKEIEKAEKENRKCDLSGTIFEGDFHCNREINTNISFSNAEFNGLANFAGAYFYEEANFEKTKFYGASLFFGTKFKKNANFSQAYFDKDSNFMTTIFNGKVDFFGTEFNKYTAFFETYFNKAKFFKTKFSNKTDFNGAFFNEESFFLYTIFEQEVSFRFLFIHDKLIFRGVDFGIAYFRGTDLRKCEFIACKWIEKGGRYILGDEIELFKIKENPPTEKEIQEGEDLYRNFKIKAKEMHNEYDVSRWHYSEKEMLRKRTSFRKSPFDWLILNLYWLFSGYGENPARAALWFLLLIISYFALILYFGVEPVSPDINNFSWNLENVLKIFVSAFEMIFFKSPTYYKLLNVWGNFIRILAQIFIYIQITLLILALRNRFRRA